MATNLLIPKLWTKNGLGILGQLIREAREAKGWSQREVSKVIREQIGYSISDRGICNVEKNVGMPHWNTLAAIAAVGFVINPATGVPFTEDDFSDIAAEVLNPYTGHTGRRHYQGFTIMTSQNADGNSITEIINEFLERTGTTIDQLAKFTYIQRSRLEKIARGKIQPTESDVTKLAACREFTKINGSRWEFVELLTIFKGRPVFFETETSLDLENLEGQETDSEDQLNSENHVNGVTGI